MIFNYLFKVTVEIFIFVLFYMILNVIFL